MPTSNYLVVGEKTYDQIKDLFQTEASYANWDSIKDEIDLYDKINEYKGNMENINTGMIMDAVNNTVDMPEKNEAMQAAIDNDQIKKLQVLAQRYKDAHTQKIREYPKIGRNDMCPCGSGKKYKNCCLSSGKYENKIMKK